MPERTYVKTVPAKAEVGANDPKHIFEDEFERLKESLDTGTNTVLVSEPYGGRDTLLEELSTHADGVERRSFLSVADAEGRIPDEADVCLVDGCRYLYTRRIGGFGPLESFVESVAASDATVVASWNSYAWSYARHATDIEDVLTEEVVLPDLGTPSLAELLASEYDVSEFESDLEETREEGESFVDRLPPQIRFRLEERSDNTFEKISALSGGNPGVARAVFEDRTWEKESGDDGGELSYEDAFTLLVVLTKEEVERDVLEEVASPRSLEKSLRRLSDAGYVERDDGRVVIRPERLVDAVERLERRHLVW